ncbi:MAG TPA: hypothetical protein VIW24_25910 [Aldersonia sp.]
MTPFGLMQQTSLSRDVVEAAARLKLAGLLEVLVDDERRYDSWRIDEAAHGLPRRQRGCTGAAATAPAVGADVTGVVWTCRG